MLIRIALRRKRASQLGVAVPPPAHGRSRRRAAPPDDIAPTVLSRSSEAAQSAIRARLPTRPSEGWFELDASLVPVEAGRPGPLLTVTVRDGGRWRNKPPGAGGLGIGLMARLMDEFDGRVAASAARKCGCAALVGKTPTMNGAAGLVNVVPRRPIRSICEVEGEIDASNVESVFDQQSRARRAAVPAWCST
jgi:hypothetical protein